MIFDLGTLVETEELEVLSYARDNVEHATLDPDNRLEDEANDERA